MANEAELKSKQLRAQYAQISELIKLEKERVAIQQMSKGMVGEELRFWQEQAKLLHEIAKDSENELKRKKEELDVHRQLNEEMSKAWKEIGFNLDVIGGRFEDVISGQKTVTQKLKEMKTESANIAKILFSWRGGLGLALTLIGAILKAQEKVNEVMREWRVSQATVAQSMGAMSKDWRHVKSMRLNMRSTNADISDIVVEGAKMVNAFGMSSDSVGKMMFGLKNSQMSAKHMKMFMFDINTASVKGQIPIELISKDMAEATEYMAAFGQKGIRDLPKMSQYANQLGVGLSTVVKSMDIFDKLSTGSEAVGRLGAIFGVQLNAMKMLVQTDPAKRLEAVRDELIASGKEWKNMSYYEVKALSTTLNLSQKEVQAIFDRKNGYKSVAEIQEGIEKEKKNEEVAEMKRKKDMNYMLKETSKLFRDMGPQIKSFYMAINNAFAPLYDSLFGGKKGLLEGITSFFNKLAKNQLKNYLIC